MIEATQGVVFGTVKTRILPRFDFCRQTSYGGEEVGCGTPLRWSHQSVAFISFRVAVTAFDGLTAVHIACCLRSYYFCQKATCLRKDEFIRVTAGT